MAMDLEAELDAPAPASVAHLLAETVARLPQASHDRALPLKGILDALSEKGAPLRELVSSEPLPAGRVPILSMIEQAVLQNTGVLAAVAERTGLGPETPFTLPEVAMACFRGLQARFLVQPES